MSRSEDPLQARKDTVSADQNLVHRSSRDALPTGSNEVSTDPDVVQDRNIGVPARDHGLPNERRALSNCHPEES